MAAMVPFDEVNRAALAALPALLDRWLPNGRREGPEWVALNPLRADAHFGSFKVNLRTGYWADFALDGVRGRDLIGLAAYLHGLDRVTAGRELAGMLGIPLIDPQREDPGHERHGQRAFAPLSDDEKASGRRRKGRAKSTFTPMPVMGDVVPPEKRHPKLGLPKVRYRYRNAAGGLEGFVCRDWSNKGTFTPKEPRPLRFGVLNGGELGDWHWRGWADDEQAALSAARAAGRARAARAGGRGREDGRRRRPAAGRRAGADHEHGRRRVATEDGLDAAPGPRRRGLAGP